MLIVDVIGSKAKAAVFKLLFGLTDDELHVREMSRRSGLAQPSLRAEMKTLYEQGLVIPRRSGNRLYYRANRHHPLASGGPGTRDTSSERTMPIATSTS